MTGATVADDAGVIERRRNPCDGGVAIIAGVAAHNVRWRLASGDRAIVARATRANDLGVIHGVGRDPQGIVVTILADVGRADVSW